MTFRLKAIMSLQIKLATEEFITRITEVEPGLVLKFLADHQLPYVVVDEVVHPRPVRFGLLHDDPVELRGPR